MHNRFEKIQIFASNTAYSKVREVAGLLGELRDIESFRSALHEHLAQARQLMTDHVAATLNLDAEVDALNDDNNNGN